VPVFTEPLKGATHFSLAAWITTVSAICGTIVSTILVYNLDFLYNNVNYVMRGKYMTHIGEQEEMLDDERKRKSKRA